MAVVKGGLQPAIGLTQTPSTGFLASQPLSVTMNLVAAFNNGTTADNIDLVAVKVFTFVASTGQTVDFTSMLDILGGAVNFARVNLFALRVEGTTDAATLTLTPDASNGWSTGFLAASSSIVLKMATAATNPNGAFAIFSAPNTTGWPVDGTHKVLDFTPSAHAFTATLVVAGRSV